MKDSLTIGICDDEVLIFEKMTGSITQYAKENQIKIDVRYYSSGVALLQRNDTEELDILFLDIDMPELDGIETAYQFNKQSNSCKIVMLTSKVERFKDAFKIGAFRFVTKPIEQQEVFSAINDVRGHMIGDKTFTLYRDGIAYTVTEREITYIMIEKTSSYVFTDKYDFRSDETLNWWENALDARMFFRCHKGYIVNLGKIKEIEKDVVMQTGERISVARRRKNELEQVYMEYDTKYRWG